jgi:tetratricopeptide (TPR) repeat protein
VLLERLSKRSIQRTEYIWAKAEVFRLRNEGNDIDNAITNYQLAISSGEAPVEAYRGIGLAWRQKGEKNRALEALARYLNLAPTAQMQEWYAVILRN